MKNLKLVLLILMIVSVIFAFGACKGEPDPDPTPTPPVDTPVDPNEGLLEGDLTITETNLNVTLGSEQVVRVMIGEEVLNCSWESDNENVVTIIGNGRIVGNNLGSAKVTATYGDRSISCNVTVALNDRIAVLNLDCTDGDSVQIDNKHSLYLGGKVLFNGNEYDDVTCTYTLADTTLGTIQDGVFTPAKTGESTITVVASWRGVESPLLTKTITVKVVESVQLLINGSPSLADIDIYSVDSFAGITYKNSHDFDVTMLVNGNPVTPVINVQDTEIATFDASANKIVGNAMGSTVVTMSYENGDVSIQKQVVINVQSPVAVYPHKIVMFSAMDGDLVDENGIDVLATEFGGANAVVSANQTDKELDVSTGKILGVETTREGLTKTVITVYGKKFGYTFNVEGYTKVLRTANDLKALAITKSGMVLDGYFYLNNDIDLTEDADFDHKINTTQWDAIYASSWFTGIFAGNGHVINGYAVFSDPRNNSFFGRVEGGIIKDVAFTNVQIMDGNSVLFACMSGFNLDTYYQNIFVHIKEGRAQGHLADRTSPYSLFSDWNKSTLHLDNVVIYQQTASASTVSRVSGQGVGLFRRDRDVSYASMNGVFMITPVASNGRVVPIYQSSTQTIYAENIFTDISDMKKVAIDGSGNPVLDTNGSRVFLHYPGIKQYESFQAMATAGYSQVGNWTISSGEPVWTPSV